MSERLPSIAITVGDVAGIGPEIALKAAGLPSIRQRCRPVIYGPEILLRQIASRMSIATDGIDFHDVGQIDASEIQAGQFSAATGSASYQAVIAAIDDAVAGRVDAVTTGPIQKEAWHQAGVRVPGHTEVFADRTGTDQYAMMLSGPPLACVLVTIHIPLADVAAKLSIESIARTIRLAAPVAMARRRVAAEKELSSPSRTIPPDAPRVALGRIGVCGLNPHAGENGLMGHGEEERLIVPAIELARGEGLNVVGPLPPDTAFTPRMRSQIDVFVCMYHDQGLIPLKALAFDDGVNTTLGLPIVRTSVDHGTAMDLARRGIASSASMEAAIHDAIELCRR